jgi:hypothetical protein
MKPDPDRRQSPRHPADPRTACDLLLGSSVTDRALAVVNLSRGGARLLVGRPVSPGEMLWAFLRHEGRRLYCMRMARVVYAHPVSGEAYPHPVLGGAYHLGVAFYRDLDAFEIDGLCVGGAEDGVAPPEPGPP